VPVERIELPTFGLQNRCSTAELNRQLIDARNRHYRIWLPPPGDDGAGAPSDIRVVPPRLLARTKATGTKSPRKAAVSARCRRGKPASARWSLTAEAAPGPWRPDRRPVRSKPCRRCIRIWGARRQRPVADLPSPQLVEAQAPALPVSGNQRNRCMKLRSTEQGLTAPVRPPAHFQRLIRLASPRNQPVSVGLLQHTTAEHDSDTCSRPRSW
jgi:hypothetical protein